MIYRRREGQVFRPGINLMWSRYLMDGRIRWYVGLFVRIGDRIFGFRYRWPTGILLTGWETRP